MRSIWISSLYSDVRTNRIADRLDIGCEGKMSKVSHRFLAWALGKLYDIY